MHNTMNNSLDFALTYRAICNISKTQGKILDISDCYSILNQELHDIKMKLNNLKLNNKIKQSITTQMLEFEDDEYIKYSYEALEYLIKLNETPQHVKDFANKVKKIIIEMMWNEVGEDVASCKLLLCAFDKWEKNNYGKYGNKINHHILNIKTDLQLWIDSHENLKKENNVFIQFSEKPEVYIMHNNHKLLDNEV